MTSDEVETVDNIDPNKIYDYRELANLVPGHPSLQTVRRWINRGIRTNGGKRRLEPYARTGRNIYVKGQSLIDFLVPAPEEPVIPRRTPAKRLRDSQRARRELRKRGI